MKRVLLNFPLLLLLLLLLVLLVLLLLLHVLPALRRLGVSPWMKNRLAAAAAAEAPCEVREQQKQKGYNHKCSVCGKTDTDYPNMQFRYCSKCAGYHCYCEDHIFDHVHFTE